MNFNKLNKRLNIANKIANLTTEISVYLFIVHVYSCLILGLDYSSSNIAESISITCFQLLAFGVILSLATFVVTVRASLAGVLLRLQLVDRFRAMHLVTRKT